MATKVVEKVKAKNNLTKGQQFILRMQLLGLVLLKNIYVFIWLGVLSCMIMSLTGVIDQNTPILKYIFGDLAETVEDIVHDHGGSMDIVEAIGSVVSLMFATTLCCAKIKRLSLKDIKSNKTKLMLVRAGLYFDESGRLTKRLETITKIDINSDGKIGDSDEVPSVENETIIDSLVKAGEEFVTVLKVDLSEVGSEDTVYKTVGLDETKEGVDEIKSEVKEKTKKLLLSNTDKIEDENLKKVSIFVKVANGIKKLFKSLKRANNTTKIKKKETVVPETTNVVEVKKPNNKNTLDGILNKAINQKESSNIEVVETPKVESIQQVEKEDKKETISESKKEEVKNTSTTNSTSRINIKKPSSVATLDSILKNIKK